MADDTATVTMLVGNESSLAPIEDPASKDLLSSVKRKTDWHYN